MLKKYVAVSGIVDESEANFLSNELSSHSFVDKKYFPMIGIFVNSRSIREVESHSLRYPSISKIPLLIETIDKRALPFIIYDNSNSSNMFEEVVKLFNWLYNSGTCKTIQININWPQVGDIKKIKKRFSELEIILQVSHTTVHPDEVSDRIEKYGSTIGGILLDPSTERRSPRYSENLIKIYKEVNEKFPQLNIGFAGGLSNENIATRIEKLVKLLPGKDFSISVAEGLRYKTGLQHGEDLLDRDAVHIYLKTLETLLKDKEDK